MLTLSGSVPEAFQALPDEAKQFVKRYVVVTIEVHDVVNTWPQTLLTSVMLNNLIPMATQSCIPIQTALDAVAFGIPLHC
jgi:hypothetical protein